MGAEVLHQSEGTALSRFLAWQSGVAMEYMRTAVNVHWRGPAFPRHPRRSHVRTNDRAGLSPLSWTLMTLNKA